jgi:hypothetical protein
MSHTIDLTGRKFGKLTVIKQGISNTKPKNAMWICECDCGKIATVSSRWLRAGRIKSCGCYRSRRNGLSQSNLYKIWNGMIFRCENKKSSRYNRYGGRGIGICESWRSNFQSFYDWGLSNGYEKGLTIDRINNDGNYEPSNCRFLTRGENSSRKGKYWGINARLICSR